MTATEGTRRAYRAYRRAHPYTPAAFALHVAKRETTEPAWADAFDGLTGTVDGWDITITVEMDEYADALRLGAWTDDPADAVPNPEYQHGNYKYFRPENVEDWQDYHRAGMSREDAQATVRRHMEDDARAALQPQYCITVTASREGIELGSDSLGGCDIEAGTDALWTVDDHGMVDIAVDEAKAALAKLTATAVDA